MMRKAARPQVRRRPWGMHSMGDRQVPQSVLVGCRQARKPHTDMGRDEYFFGTVRIWGLGGQGQIRE